MKNFSRYFLPASRFRLIRINGRLSEAGIIKNTEKKKSRLFLFGGGAAFAGRTQKLPIKGIRLETSMLGRFIFRRRPFGSPFFR